MLEYLINFRILHKIGKISKMRQSASNILIIRNFLFNRNNKKEYGTSEILRKECYQHTKKSLLKLTHRNIHKSILHFTDYEFGYYLAGLIESNNYILKENQIILTFNRKDISFV